jgi:hypothetical protein
MPDKDLNSFSCKGTKPLAVFCIRTSDFVPLGLKDAGKTTHAGTTYANNEHSTK